MHGAPPLSFMLLLALLPALVVTFALWKITRDFEPTGRHFARLVWIAALCTPVPIGNAYDVSWLPGYFVAFLVLPFAGRANGALLAYTIAVSTTSVLGAILLVLHTALQIHDLRRR